MSDITKQVFIGESGRHRFILNMGNYGRSVKAIELLIAEAKKDFPYVTSENMDLLLYNSPSYYAIEFYGDEIPSNYVQILRLEDTK